MRYIVFAFVFPISAPARCIFIQVSCFRVVIKKEEFSPFVPLACERTRTYFFLLVLSSSWCSRHDRPCFCRAVRRNGTEGAVESPGELHFSVFHSFLAFFCVYGPFEMSFAISVLISNLWIVVGGSGGAEKKTMERTTKKWKRSCRTRERQKKIRNVEKCCFRLPEERNRRRYFISVVLSILFNRHYVINVRSFEKINTNRIFIVFLGWCFAVRLGGKFMNARNSTYLYHFVALCPTTKSDCRSWTFYVHNRRTREDPFYFPYMGF